MTDAHPLLVPPLTDELRVGSARGRVREAHGLTAAGASLLAGAALALIAAIRVLS